MEIQSIISIIIEAFALIISIFILFFLAIQKSRKRIDRCILWMVALTIILLLGDIFAYGYRGNPSQVGWYIVRISNFLVFLTNYMIFVSYGVCLRESIKHDNNLTLWHFRAVLALVFASIALLILSQFGGFLYYFDENNFYHRGPMFILTQVAPVLGGSVYFGIIIANRRKMQRNESVALGLYLLLPFFATLFQLFVYGYPIQTVAGVIGCWGIFLAREVSVRNQLSQTLTEKEEKQAELEKLLATVNEQFLVLKSMSEVYYSMHLIDLENDSVKEFNAQNEVQDIVNNPFGAAKMMINTISVVTSEEYKEAALRFTNLTTLSERMHNKRTISEEFFGNRLGWYRAQFIAIEADASGNPTRVVFTTQDIDEEKRRNDTLIQKSQTDELTGFYNRRAYEEDIAKYKGKPIEESFVYISFDVNGLKTVNDTLGHAAGDELIISACQCMKDAFGDLGRLYRTGGDEFVCLAFADEMQLKKALCAFEEATSKWSGILVKGLSVSYGVISRKETPGASVEEIAIIADQRMYSAKREYYQKSGIDRRRPNDRVQDNW